MEVEGRRIIEYLEITKYYSAILIAWSIIGTILSITLPASIFEVVGINMAVYSPIFMIFIYGHMGYTFMKKWKFRRIGQAVFAGIVSGFISGFVAGFLMMFDPTGKMILETYFVSSMIQPGMLIVLAFTSAIVTAVLRAIFGAIFAYLGGLIVKTAR